MVSSNDVTPLEKGAAFREPPGTALIKKDRQKFNKSPGSQRLQARVLRGPFVEFLEQSQTRNPSSRATAMYSHCRYAHRPHKSPEFIRLHSAKCTFTVFSW